MQLSGTKNRLLTHVRLYLLVLFLSLSACSPGVEVLQPTAQQTVSNSTAMVTPVVTTPGLRLPSATIPATDNLVSNAAEIPSSPAPLATTTKPTPTHLAPDDWKTLPIIPSVSPTARQIYQRGLKMGNDAHAFSKIGDCQSITTYFLEYFDMPGLYDLGPYSSLQETIDWYSGSFERNSLATKGGFNAAAILSPLRADQKQCLTKENPIACELRLHKPSVAIISLEEWWAGHPENYEKYLRQIVEYAISQGVVPIIATKADNIEGNYLINQTIANLAQEYDIPMWNFWASVQDLPNHGLAAYDPFGNVDLFHLTHGNNYEFSDDPSIERSGWTMRNLTALQVLDAVRRGLNEQP